MIGRVHKRGHDLARLLGYLYSPGRRAEHVNPRLVGGWEHPGYLEPPVRDSGQRDFRRLTGLMQIPVFRMGTRAPDEYVWHCTVRAAPGDPLLGDGAWMEIAAEIMDRTGLSRRGHEAEGVPWVAVHHGDQHIHIVAVLARQDGQRAALHNDYYRIGEALADLEDKLGLALIARPDRTAARRPTRAETEKARRAGRSEPPRVTLRRLAAAAAAAARSEAEFWAGLEDRGLRVRFRRSMHIPGQVTGYAVALPGDLTGRGEPVWFGGGQLAADLTLPKLRCRWPGPARPGPGRAPGRVTGRERLSGARMPDRAARAALRHEVARAGAAARSEAEFWAGLEAAGLLVRQRPGTRPGDVTGYSVSLPGLPHHRDRRSAYYSGWKLGPRMTLSAMRARWRDGQPGVGPGAEIFGEADVREIYAYAATVAATAAQRLRAARGPEAADIAWAAADLIAAAAEATGNAGLRKAADGFARAGRPAWARIPAPSPGGGMLRTAAWLLAACRPGGLPARTARVAVVSALAGLARTLAVMRDQQQRMLQAAAAREAAAGLDALHIPAWPGPAPAPAPGPAGDGPRPAAAAWYQPGLFPGPGQPPRPAPGRAGRRRRPAAAATGQPVLFTVPGPPARAGPGR